MGGRKTFKYGVFCHLKKIPYLPGKLMPECWSKFQGNGKSGTVALMAAISEDCRQLFGHTNA
jgi:hypothetical protein